MTAGSSSSRVAVVGLNMGGPIDQSAVEPFLAALFADQDLVRLPAIIRPFQSALGRRIARRRSHEVGKNYALIGGGSPILRHTEAQMEGTCARLRELGIQAKAGVAMRYTPPRAEEAVRRLVEWAPTRIVALSLYPQFSPATGGSSLADFWAAVDGSPLRGVARSEVKDFATEPFYLDAMAGQIRDVLAEMGPPRPHLLFSCHGLPESYIKRGDPYRDRIEQSYRGILARLPSDLEHSISFQSRVGPQRWLQPYTEAHLPTLAARGVKRLLMVPLGFVSDHIETLYEMDLLYGDQAKSLGIADVRRVVALNDDRRFTRGMGDYLAGKLQGTAPAEMSAS